MAFLAQGLVDIFIDLRKKIRIQDMAAGYLLIKEAGGLMLDENLQPLDSDLSYETRLSFVAATSKEIIDEVFSLIK
jgi:myo-inositol-1(or 4)-monophosphatase